MFNCSCGSTSSFHATDCKTGTPESYAATRSALDSMAGPSHFDFSSPAHSLEAKPANPQFCCAICGTGFDFGCRCPDY